MVAVACREKKRKTWEKKEREGGKAEASKLHHSVAYKNKRNRLQVPEC